MFTKKNDKGCSPAGKVKQSTCPLASVSIGVPSQLRALLKFSSTHKSVSAATICDRAKIARINLSFTIVRKIFVASNLVGVFFYVGEILDILNLRFSGDISE